MPLYMDLDKGVPPELTANDVAAAHELDLAVQKKYGVRYISVWLNHEAGKAFCLLEAPSPDSARKVHLEAHGNAADYIVEVAPEVVDSFLGSGELLRLAEPPAVVYRDGELDSGLRIIMFTDMEGSTRLTQQLGDHRAMEVLRGHDNIIREALTQHHGHEVKHTGDGIMASFRAASPALQAAVSIQRAMAHHGDGATGTPVGVRIGFSAGEPVQEGHDLFGAAVQLAARVCARAKPGQILVSSVMRDLCIGKTFAFVDCGRARMKGFESPVHLYELNWMPESVV